MLTFAIPKGRIYKQALPLLEAVGIVPAVDPETSRQLILPTRREDIQFLILRASDVPTYVEYGAADLGIVGKDILEEYGADGLFEPLDLKIARCWLMTAAKVGEPWPSCRLRIATKYPNITRRYFASQGVQAEIIKLYGSMELAPLVGLADGIVDLVETGKTLKANGLEPRELIMEVSSRLVVNPAAMTLKHQALQEIIETLRRVVAEREEEDAASPA